MSPLIALFYMPTHICFAASIDIRIDRMLLVIWFGNGFQSSFNLCLDQHSTFFYRGQTVPYLTIFVHKQMEEQITCIKYLLLAFLYEIPEQQVSLFWTVPGCGGGWACWRDKAATNVLLLIWKYTNIIHVFTYDSSYTVLQKKKKTTFYC